VIFVISGGETAYIEFKQDKGRLSRHQEVMHQDLIDLGADVVTLVGMAMTQDFLDLVHREIRCRDSQP
jgi:hypothetical protein